MWPLGFVTALGLGISASVAGCRWGNFLCTLSKHRRGPCGPWRLLCFPSTEAEVNSGAPFGSCGFFLPLVPVGMRVSFYLTGVGTASLPGDPGPFSGEKNLSQLPPTGWRETADSDECGCRRFVSGQVSSSRGVRGLVEPHYLRKTSPQAPHSLPKRRMVTPVSPLLLTAVRSAPKHLLNLAPQLIWNPGKIKERGEISL